MRRTVAALTAAAAATGLVLAGTTADATESRTAAYTTAYSYFDNTPPGSAEISHPTLHTRAGGRGTFADPITVAVGHSIINGRDVLDVPRGTRFYFPDLRKYGIVEDTCGDGARPQNGPCHSLKTAPKGARLWVDVWIGGDSGSTRRQADDCMSKVTDATGAVHTIIRNPAVGYAVITGPVLKDGKCRAGYGNTVRR